MYKIIQYSHICVWVKIYTKRLFGNINAVIYLLIFKYWYPSVVVFADCSVFLLRKFGKIKVSSVVGIKGESFLASIGKGYPFRIFALLRCAASD